MTKYYLVGALVLIANCLLVYFLAPAGVQEIGWWFILLALVEGWLVGKLAGQLLFQWYLRDEYKALEKEFVERYGTGWSHGR